jgi:hypothetical protein
MTIQVKTVRRLGCNPSTATSLAKHHLDDAGIASQPTTPQRPLPALKPRCAEEKIVHMKEKSPQAARLIVDAKEKSLQVAWPIVYAKENSSQAASPIMVTRVLLLDNAVLFVISQDSLMHEEVLAQHRSNVAVYTTNGMLHATRATDHTQDSHMHAKDFSMHGRVSAQHRSNVRVHTANGMQHETNAIVHTQDFPMHTEGPRLVAQEHFLHTKDLRMREKKLRAHEKDPRVHNEDSRHDNNDLAHDDGASRLYDSSASAQHGTLFVQDFSPGDIGEEQNEDKSSVGMVHPPAIPCTRSAFVLKQRASVHTPAGAVDKDDTVQHSTVAGREGMAHIVRQFAMRPSCGSVASQHETLRKNMLVFRSRARIDPAQGPCAGWLPWGQCWLLLQQGGAHGFFQTDLRARSACLYRLADPATRARSRVPAMAIDQGQGAKVVCR